MPCWNAQRPHYTVEYHHDGAWHVWTRVCYAAMAEQLAQQLRHDTGALGTGQPPAVVRVVEGT